MAISVHPDIPHIRVGSPNDFAKLNGYIHDPNYIGNDDSFECWVAGASCGGYRSEEEAFEGGEKYIFLKNPEVGAFFLNEAKQNDQELFLTLSIRQSFWQGYEKGIATLRAAALPSVDNLRHLMIR